VQNGNRKCINPSLQDCNDNKTFSAQKLYFVLCSGLCGRVSLMLVTVYEYSGIDSLIQFKRNRKHPIKAHGTARHTEETRRNI